MSAPSSSTPAGDGKSPSLSKFVRRASRLLKSRSNSSAEVGIRDPSVEPRTISIDPRSIPVVVAPTTAPAATMSDPTNKSTNTPTQYLKQRESKARDLFAKYGMTLSAEEWVSPSSGKTQWVEKKIVMRVHRQCHRCQSTFGRDKTCNQCQHTRCKKCPRFPVKLSKEQTAFQGYDIDYSVLVDPARSSTDGKIHPKLLTIQTKSGRDAVRKHPTQRVRRTCHRCEKLFDGKALVCTGCQHPRCPKCPRDPPKTKKWPNGYPGDVAEKFEPAERVRKAVRLRYRWECHTCQVAFKEHEKICAGCGHERCDECPRKPPKKAKKERPQEVVESVEDKIAALAVG